MSLLLFVWSILKNKIVSSDDSLSIVDGITREVKNTMLLYHSERLSRLSNLLKEY
jgi:hypothetical protein